MLPPDFAFGTSIPIYISLLILWIICKKKFSFLLFATLFYFYVVAVISVTLFPLPTDKLFIESMKSTSTLDIFLRWLRLVEKREVIPSSPS